MPPFVKGAAQSAGGFCSEEVAYALKNHQLFSSAMLFASTALGDLDPAPEAANIISCDPPIHTRLRALVNKAFTPRIVADLEARIRDITNHLLNQVGPNGEFDIMKGLAVPVLFASGNRDERTFNQPDRFDVTRQNTQLHLGFSFGIHFCVGAGLARLEAKIAFAELLARFPGLTWQEDHVKRNFALFIVRGLETLPVQFGAR